MGSKSRSAHYFNGSRRPGPASECKRCAKRVPLDKAKRVRGGYAHIVCPQNRGH